MRAGDRDEERMREPEGPPRHVSALKRPDVSFRPVRLLGSVALSPNATNGRPVTDRPRLTFLKGRQASERAAGRWGALSAQRRLKVAGVAPRAREPGADTVGRASSPARGKRGSS